MTQINDIKQVYKLKWKRCNDFVAAYLNSEDSAQIIHQYYLLFGNEDSSNIDYSGFYVNGKRYQMLFENGKGKTLFVLTKDLDESVIILIKVQSFENSRLRRVKIDNLLQSE